MLAFGEHKVGDKSQGEWTSGDKRQEFGHRLHATHLSEEVGIGSIVYIGKNKRKQHVNNKPHMQVQDRRSEQHNMKGAIYVQTKRKTQSDRNNTNKKGTTYMYVNKEGNNT